MRFRFVSLLCLSGLAACNQQHNPPPQTSYEATQSTSPPGEPETRPASLDEPRSPNDEPPAARPLEPQATPTTERVNPSTAGAPGNASAQPDNTQVNERDRNTANPTAGDQGQNETDLRITQQIRQAVMADDSLSFTAKNVKIVTRNGKVTLRGPASSAQERNAIEAAARQVTGATQIDNQIEVKK
jgi:hypothetical protein